MNTKSTENALRWLAKYINSAFVAGWSNVSDYVAGSTTRVWTCGGMACINFNTKFSTIPAHEVAFMTGVPKAKYYCKTVLLTNYGTAMKITVNTDGTVAPDGNYSTTGWYAGTIVYPIEI